MSSIHIDIVSAERAIYSGDAAMVFAPAILGEIGIAPGHTPLVTQLGAGEVRVQVADGDERSFYVSGGVLEVQPRLITVLSDTAQRAEDLDEAAVLKAKEAVESMIHERDAKIDYAKALAEHAELAAQLRAIQRLRKK